MIDFVSARRRALNPVCLENAPLDRLRDREHLLCVSRQANIPSAY
jgi:hypothetical protein